MSFEPFGHNVLIEKDKITGTEDTFETSTGVTIYKPERSRDPAEKCWGYVIALGSGVETDVAVGDHVLYRKYAENGAPHVDDDRFVLHENELLGRNNA